jgi:hypothetical protein
MVGYAGRKVTMTLKIKFSHKYSKMPKDFEKSFLLEVFNVQLEDLGLDFVLYDTEHIYGESISYYPLPEMGDYMVLLLSANHGSGELWTTIRRRTPAKEAYYRASRGMVFDCIIEDGGGQSDGPNLQYLPLASQVF